MKGNKELGVVKKGSSKIVWTTDGWYSEEDRQAAAFLNAAGIGTEGVSSISPTAYSDILIQAMNLIHGDGFKCFVKSSSQPVGTVY